MVLVGLVACGNGASDVDDDPFDDPPDISGRYQLILEGTNGCEGNADLLDGWASGPLSVDGEPGAFEFTFADGTILSGSTDASYGFQFGGAFDYSGYALSAFGSGVVYSADGGWTLEGMLEAEASEDPNGTSDDCTIEGGFSAVQVAP